VSTPPILRLNQLRRRAAELGTDVPHVVALDATQQRESPPADAYTQDAERAEDILRMFPKQGA
jgi:hypothetical protein